MPAWSAWMAALGGRVRRVREFAGLSQEQLARAAGLSQGAISRLELAKGLGTPLLVVVKVQAALAAGLRALGSAIPTEAQDALSLPPLASRAAAGNGARRATGARGRRASG